MFCNGVLCYSTYLVPVSVHAPGHILKVFCRRQEKSINTLFLKVWDQFRCIKGDRRVGVRTALTSFALASTSRPQSASIHVFALTLYVIFATRKLYLLCVWIHHYSDLKKKINSKPSVNGLKKLTSSYPGALDWGEKTIQKNNSLQFWKRLVQNKGKWNNRCIYMLGLFLPGKMNRKMDFV